MDIPIKKRSFYFLFFGTPKPKYEPINVCLGERLPGSSYRRRLIVSFLLPGNLSPKHCFRDVHTAMDIPIKKKKFLFLFEKEKNCARWRGGAALTDRWRNGAAPIARWRGGAALTARWRSGAVARPPPLGGAVGGAMARPPSLGGAVARPSPLGGAVARWRGPHR